MKRNLNIEAFRCFLMFLIVLHHAFIRGVWAWDSGLWSLAFTSLIAWHVDGFVAISGWYGIKFSWYKFFNMWAQMAFYTLLNVVLLHFMFHEEVALSYFVVSGGWFGGSYLALMLAAPFINAGVEKISSGGGWEIRLLIILIVLSWAPFHAMSGVAPLGYEPCSFVQLALMYTIVRFLRTKFVKPLSCCKLCWCILLFIFVVSTIGVGKTIIDWPRKGLDLTAGSFVWLTHHNAPHVMLMAGAVFLLFVWYVQLPKWLLKVSEILSPSMFGIYLIHESTSSGQRLFAVIEQHFQEVMHIHPFLIIVVSAISVFIICLVIDLFRRVLLAFVHRSVYAFCIRDSMTVTR